MSRCDSFTLQRHDGQDLDLSRASGEQLLLAAVLGGARLRRQVQQELGRRAFGSFAALLPRRIPRHAIRLRVAA